MEERCPKLGRLSALLLVLSACGSSTRPETTTPADHQQATLVPARVVPTAAPPAVEVRVHPLELARRELLTTSADTPHYTEVMTELRPRIEAIDLRPAPQPTSAMTCALADGARPVMALHASGIINWNSSRFDDMEITDDLVGDWCSDLIAIERSDCGEDDGGEEWTDRCGECESDDGPSLEARRHARAHGVDACEAWEHLRSRCAAGEVLSGADALAFAASCRYDAESVFESGSCWENTADTEPAANLRYAIEVLERLARGETTPTP